MPICSSLFAFVEFAVGVVSCYTRIIRVVFSDLTMFDSLSGYERFAFSSEGFVVDVIAMYRRRTTRTVFFVAIHIIMMMRKNLCV